MALHSINERFAKEIFFEFNSEITRYMMPKPASNIEETLAFINDSKRLMGLKQEIVLVIVNNTTGEFLGCCGFHGRGKYNTPELGIWLKKSAHGHKYGMEAITTLAHWATKQLAFEYAIYPVDKANVSSRNIAESLGGEVFKELQVTSMAGIELDEVVYKIPYEKIVSTS
ncbi:MAG: GNAT family N-acetyltransferase [Aliivibrio sp.]|uniref:GNAT family N-acetyltransferase n=1 Tax=Aliivibrio sp. TaxID=1872443 RepID=UPI001A4EB3BE|nr:GNAT family N-acetyltransferase [Aliivibrio sp.]